MNRLQALQKVLELAEQNILSVDEVAGIDTLEEERADQLAATALIEGIIEDLEIGTDIGQLGAPRFWLTPPNIR